MTRIYCPICNREYEENPKVCSCGFEGLAYPVFEKDPLYREYERDQLFQMYKFTKRVFYGEIPYEKSPLDIREYDDTRIVSYAMENRGLAVVECFSAPGERQTVAEEGLLAMKGCTKALILDVDEAESNFLDESNVRILFLGEHFKRFQNGFFYPFSRIRYIFVHPQNSYFKSENNVLFSKEGTRLIFYPSSRPEEEYTVPRTVKKIFVNNFYSAENLKVLRLPIGIEISSDAVQSFEQHGMKIIYY